MTDKYHNSLLVKVTGIKVADRTDFYAGDKLYLSKVDSYSITSDIESIKGSLLAIQTVVKSEDFENAGLDITFDNSASMVISLLSKLIVKGYDAIDILSIKATENDDGGTRYDIRYVVRAEDKEILLSTISVGSEEFSAKTNLEDACAIVKRKLSDVGFRYTSETEKTQC